MGRHPFTQNPFVICPNLGHGPGDGDPLVAPLVQSTTFRRDGVGSNPPHQYSRVSNPTVAALESALGALEDAPPAACFTTGLAAETALFLALLKAGDHVVCGRSVYGGTTRLLRSLLPDLGIDATFTDATDLDAVRRAVGARTKLLLVETPANPTLDVTDLAACAAIAHERGARLAVDNTFLTAVGQRPLDFGADVTVQSTTKLVDGHALALGGAIVSRDAALLERVRFVRKSTGAIQTPFDAWLTLNGLRTLPVRLERQSRTAETVAGWLAPQPSVVAVHHPSLATGRARALAEAQHLGTHGTVVSFELDGGLDAGRAFAQALTTCTLAEHVGSIETLLTHPASMTHADVDPAERRAAGLSDGLLRLSVGLEPAGAIIDDLARGLAAAACGREVASCAIGA